MRMTTRRKGIIGAIVVLIAVLGIVLATQLGALSYQGVVDGFRAHGAAVQDEGIVSSGSLGGVGRQLTVNGAAVGVYEYRTTFGSGLDARTISADGATISRRFGPFGSTVTREYSMPPHWFSAGRVLVFYDGQDASLVGLLCTVVGPQFAGGALPPGATFSLSR